MRNSSIFLLLVVVALLSTSFTAATSQQQQHWCPLGFWGDECQLICPNCAGFACNTTDGRCLVTNRCASRFVWGPFCAQNCSGNCASRLGFIDQTGSCHAEDGVCEYGCAPGFHGARCDKKCPATCSSSVFGCEQFSGQCYCAPGLYGASCQQQCVNCAQNSWLGNQQPSCRPSDGKCLWGCFFNYTNRDSFVPYVGPYCNLTCNSECKFNCIYNKNSGSTNNNNNETQCTCNDNFYPPPKCDKVCPDPNCVICANQDGRCTECAGGMFLAAASGICTPCPAGCPYQCDGITGHCSGGCLNGLYGAKCDKQCQSSTLINARYSGNGCDQYSGAVDSNVGCKHGWSGPFCNISMTTLPNCVFNQLTNVCTGCGTAFWGDDCFSQCPSGCASNEVGCHRDTGVCRYCNFGKWGKGCEHNCGFCADTYVSCDQLSGNCDSQGCVVGYAGESCATQCSANCAGDGRCDRYNFTCFFGCTAPATGGKVTGPTCNLQSSASEESNTMELVGGVIGGLLVGGVFVGLIFNWLYSRRLHGINRNANPLLLGGDSGDGLPPEPPGGASARWRFRRAAGGATTSNGSTPRVVETTAANVNNNDVSYGTATDVIEA